MDVSKNIIKIREAKRIKQSEVADKLNMERPNYSRIEKRGLKMSLEQLIQIAEALDVPFWDLLADSDRVTQPFVDILKEENKKLLVKLIDIEDDKRRLKKEIKSLEEELDDIYSRSRSNYVRAASSILLPIIFKKFQDSIKVENTLEGEISNEVYVIFEELISMDKGLFSLDDTTELVWDINESHISSLMSSERGLKRLLNINQEDNAEDYVLLFMNQYLKFIKLYIKNEQDSFEKEMKRYADVASESE